MLLQTVLYDSKELGHDYSSCDVVPVFVVFSKALPRKTAEWLIFAGADTEGQTRACVRRVLSVLLPVLAEDVVRCAQSASARENRDWCLEVLEYREGLFSEASGWVPPADPREQKNRVREWVTWWEDSGNREAVNAGPDCDPGKR